MIERIVCNHCPYQNQPNGCDGCLAGIAYDVAEEREKRIRRRESIAISKRHKRIKVLKQMGRVIR